MLNPATPSTVTAKTGQIRAPRMSMDVPFWRSPERESGVVVIGAGFDDQYINPIGGGNEVVLPNFLVTNTPNGTIITAAQPQPVIRNVEMCNCLHGTPYIDANGVCGCRDNIEQPTQTVPQPQTVTPTGTLPNVLKDIFTTTGNTPNYKPLIIAGVIGIAAILIFKD